MMRREKRGEMRIPTTPINANNPIVNGLYPYGGPASKKVRVVQKDVNVAEVQRVIKQTCTSSGCRATITGMEARMRG